MKKLLALRHIEYIVVDRNFKIIETSRGVQRFADCPEELSIGKDVRLSFPELIGLEDILTDILKENTDSFELKGVARFSDNSSPFYMDINITNYEEETNLETQLIILLEDSTARMVKEQKLGQVAKEYSLALIALEKAKDYTDKIIHSMTDVMLVISKSGIIKNVNRAALDLFGYSESELIKQPISIIVADENFERLACQQNLWTENPLLKDVEVNCKTKSGKKLSISFSGAALSRDMEDSEDFVWIGRDITDRKQTEILLRQQWERERLLEAITQRIRQSLSLAEILNTTVAEVRQFFLADRVIIYPLAAEKYEIVAAESVASGYASALRNNIYNSCFQNHLAIVNESGQISAIEDIYTANLDQCYIDILAQFQVRAKLVVPILNGENLWGLLIVHQCDKPRQWHQCDVDLLEQLAAQVAIAIQQAELYQKLQAANRELERLVMLDGLTQMSNRRHFDKTLNFEWKRLARQQAPLSLILCDVDFFKKYNDTYGHLGGDFCLQQIANVLRSVARRPADLAARYGGEEFAMILPHTDLAGAVHIAELIREKVRSLKIAHANSPVSHYVTLSFGVASTIPVHSSTPETLINAADKALYEAKANGRDRVNVCA